ncbi:unnamed protein product [Parnassius apollo]|uniref:(apollo) hypothetical protein n=1 Tax=Parnassius apollo TaxID=110799 RepID=A0A8S3YC26_PARAO|nr:unnamed protein product [Parnassius apollo]
MNEEKKNLKLNRCVDWLQKQNEQEPKKLSLQNKNDIQFIIQTNTDRKNFLLAAAEDEATVPPGVDETEMEPKPVPLRRLRVENLCLECEWHSCRWKFSDYDLFQKHVADHISDLHVIKKEKIEEKYVCMWDICGHTTSDFNEICRHINYHAYHAKLLAIGYNGRATLNLARCKKDSSKRNQLPPSISVHRCMWVDCDIAFNSMQIQTFRTFKATDRCRSGSFSITSNFMKLCDHLLRQNVNPQTSYHCSFCGLGFASAYLEREHSRQHVSLYACSLCDMSAPTLSALALHVRYRHLGAHAHTHACPHCSHRAVTKCDLRKHILTHTRKKKKKKVEIKNEEGISDRESLEEENSDEEVVKKPKIPRKYACHMCPEKEMKIFSRGTRLTTHLIKVHGAQWPFGHSRFRYQLSEDGMYRLTTTRIEDLEVSKKIVDGYSGPKNTLTNSFEFDVKQIAEPTESTPTHFMITMKSNDVENVKIEQKEEKNDNSVEITMCDVDEHGNIINSKVIKSDVVYA